MNSWSTSTFCLVWEEMALPTEYVSAKLTSAITTAGPKRELMVSKSRGGKIGCGSPPGIAPIMATPFRCNSNTVIPIVAPTMAIRPAGKFVRIFWTPKIIPSAKRPTTNVGICTAGKPFIISTSLGKMYSCRDTLMPKKWGSWVAIMISAAAEVNPLTAEWEIKNITIPRRNNPMRIYKTPTIKASRKASLTNWSLPGSAIGVSVVRTSRLIIAMGPVASWRKLPQRAPIIGVTAAA